MTKTRDIKVSFERVNDVLSVSATWCKLGAGVYGVKCSKEATKGFSKSSRFAGRDGVTIDINKKEITLTDNLPQLAGFECVTAQSLSAVLNGKNGEKERAAFLDHVKKIVDIWAGLVKEKPILRGVGLTTKNGYQFYEQLELAARVDGLQEIAFSFEGVHFLIEMTAAEFENEKAAFGKLDHAAKIVHFRAILKTRKMSLPKYRRGAQLVDAGAVDVDKTEEFWRAATKDIDTREIANKAGKKFFNKPNSKKIKVEFPAVAKEPRRVRAAFLIAILTKEESAEFLQVEKPALKVVTLDRKDLQAPAAAVKEKVVKELTAAPAEKPAGRVTVASLLALARNNSRPIPPEFLQDYRKHYSTENIALLYLQAPGATAVKTYRAWLKAGRQVKKGEHGAKILAPRMVEKTNKAGEAIRVIDGLRLVTLFDISQTELVKVKEA